MDRRFLTVLGASLVFALVVSGIFYQVVAGAKARANPTKVVTRDLVVAARSLPPGIIVQATDVKIARAPTDQFPPGGFSRVEDVIGRPVASSILADEPVREGRLAAKGSGVGLAPVIPPGMRAVAVRVNEVVGVAGFVLPGMRVDVLVTGRLPHDEGNHTKTILQDILVLSAGQNTEADASGKPVNVPVVTLLVSPEQAETLTLASDWRLQLVLRNASDRGVEHTPGRQVVELFGSPAPAPAPRVVRVAAPAPSEANPPAQIVVIHGNPRTVEQVGVRMP